MRKERNVVPGGQGIKFGDGGSGKIGSVVWRETYRPLTRSPLAQNKSILTFPLGGDGGGSDLDVLYMLLQLCRPQTPAQ
jgi:hypothetical protein